MRLSYSGCAWSLIDAIIRVTFDAIRSWHTSAGSRRLARNRGGPGTSPSGGSEVMRRLGSEVSARMESYIDPILIVEVNDTSVNQSGYMMLARNRSESSMLTLILIDFIIFVGVSGINRGGHMGVGSRLIWDRFGSRRLAWGSKDPVAVVVTYRYDKSR